MTTVLAILDGWGHRESSYGNAVKQASTPVYDTLYSQSLRLFLKAHGSAVGLEEHFSGNSEVGHITLGTGRPPISPFRQLKQYLEPCNLDFAKIFQPFLHEREQNFHLIGIFSQGGVHGLDELTYQWCKYLISHFSNRIFLHIISDGRDEPFGKFHMRLKELRCFLKDKPQISCASVIGRFYAMDRDQNKERTRIFIDALEGKAQVADDLFDAAIKALPFLKNKSEEFLNPLISKNYSSLKKGDLIVNLNYRVDRARQWFSTLFNKRDDLYYFSTVDLGLKIDYSVIVKEQKREHTLTEHLFKAGLNQLRVTESEKLPHLTYYFDGKQHTYQSNYHLEVLPSPQVLSWASAPEMSARKIAQIVSKALRKKAYDFIVVNFPNADLVGHSGDFQAALKACQAIDQALGVIQSSLTSGDHFFLTSDHGNCERLLTSEGRPHTAHTLSFVPFLYLGPWRKTHRLTKQGQLGQVSATILETFHLQIPEIWEKSLWSC